MRGVGNKDGLHVAILIVLRLPIVAGAGGDLLLLQLLLWLDR